jgi:hypothetical protein
MIDLDPQLLRLREIEARIAFAEEHIKEQRAIVRRLTQQGFTAVLAHELLQSMLEALDILQERHRHLLDEMQHTPETDLARHAAER